MYDVGMDGWMDVRVWFLAVCLSIHFSWVRVEGEMGCSSPQAFKTKASNTRIFIL